MIGRTNVGGGGNTFALIVVTYPAGSVCTCSDGTRTIRAKGTTGSFVFNIPYAGMWAIKCTDGTLESTKDVSISTKGQSENVTLVYDLMLNKEDLSLFESLGVLFQGASATAESPIKTIGGSAVTFDFSGLGTGYAYNGIVYYPEPINADNYSALKYTGSIRTSQNDADKRTGIYIWRSIPAGTQNINTTLLKSYVPAGKNQSYNYSDEQLISISDISGEIYIGFALGQWKGGPVTEVIASNIKLLKR